MKGFRPFNISSNYAVSEVIATMLLILIAIAAFSVIYLNFNFPEPDYKTPVKIWGEVNDNGNIVLHHKGGSSLENYKIIIRYASNGTLIGSKTIQGDNWSIGTDRYPFEMLEITGVQILRDTDMIEISIYNTNKDGSQERVFNGILMGEVFIEPDPGLDFMLITSLKCYSTDEDLICFNHSVNSSLNVTSYIFKWMLNGYSFAQILMPFDIESNTIAKDYSDNNLEGDVTGAVWAEDGIIGGCYQFDGAGDSIDSQEVPEMFEDIARGDCTISIWIKSYDVQDDNNVIFEVCDNYPGYKTYIRLFQFGSEVHVCVLEDHTRYVVRTDENITNNEWYHIACTWDSSTKEVAIFLNGVKSTKIGNREPPFGSQDGFSLGHGSASSPFWYGELDELQIFDRVLSDEQIYYLYLTQKYAEQNLSMIASQETQAGELWQCLIIPNDGIQEDTTWESNILQIINYGGG